MRIIPLVKVFLESPIRIVPGAEIVKLAPGLFRSPPRVVGEQGKIGVRLGRLDPGSLRARLAHGVTSGNQVSGGVSDTRSHHRAGV